MTGWCAQSRGCWSPLAWRSWLPATHLMTSESHVYSGQGTAVTLGIMDVVYAFSGRISKVYLADAVVETA